MMLLLQALRLQRPAEKAIHRPEYPQNSQWNKPPAVPTSLKAVVTGLMIMMILISMGNLEAIPRARESKGVSHPFIRPNTHGCEKLVPKQHPPRNGDWIDFQVPRSHHFLDSWLYSSPVHGSYCIHMWNPTRVQQNEEPNLHDNFSDSDLFPVLP